MTKKHFKEFAALIAAMENREHAKACADLVAKVSRKHNANFNPITFYNACGLPVPQWF